jgi:sRNA-binding carbon storage regulator CsrA
MPLVLSIKKGEIIELTGPGKIECHDLHGGYAYLTFTAPPTTRILRLDLSGKIKGAQRKKIVNAQKKTDI